MVQLNDKQDEAQNGHPSDEAVALPGPYRLHQMETGVIVAVGSDGTGREFANCLNSFGDQEANAIKIVRALRFYDAAVARGEVG